MSRLACHRLLFVLALAISFLMPYSQSRAANDGPTGGTESTTPTLSVRTHLPMLSTYQNVLPVQPSGPNCRYGAVPITQQQVAWVPNFGAQWYTDFSSHEAPAARNLEYLQMIRLHQPRVDCNYQDSYTTVPALTDSELGWVLGLQRGATWIIGNEPDRGPNPGDCAGEAQDAIMPQMYARIYHDAYQFIKARDPRAQIATAGLVEVTPGRMQYWDRVSDAYQQQYGQSMPVDVWSMHLYVLPEVMPDGQPNGVASVALGTDIALAMRESGGDPSKCGGLQGVYCWADHDNMAVFDQQVRRMRTWMKEHDYQDRPLIITEYSLLYPFADYNDPVNPTQCYLMDEHGKCFTAARVSNFVKNSFDYLETTTDANLGYPKDNNRLVQQWLWFAIWQNRAGYVSNLMTRNLDALTPVGEMFSTQVASRPLSVNLLPDPPAPITNVHTLPAGTATATLTVTVRNNGNTQAWSPFTVTFYSNEGLTQPIGSATIPADLGGCARHTASATVTWSGLAAGTHTYWVRVDSASAVSESNENDNVTSGTVSVSAAEALPSLP